MNRVKISAVVCFMFVTGILQLDLFGIKWEYYAFVQALHIIGSIVLSLFILIPFINIHSYKHIKAGRNSFEGYLLSISLVLLFASGIYLFLVGNRGGDIVGESSFYVHLVVSFVLLAFLFAHTKKRVDIAVVLLTVFLYPNFSYAKEVKMTNLTLEKGVERYHKEDWTNSVKCKECHEDIFNQWADSNHRHMVGSNPYYMVLETLAAKDMGEEFRQWCIGCHNPSAFTSGIDKTSHFMDGNLMPTLLFDKRSKNLVEEFEKFGSTRIEEGVSCIACHRITEADAKGNASYRLELSNRKKHAFEDSDDLLGDWLAKRFINSDPATHKESYMKPLYKDPKYCASCHNETLPHTGKKVVSTYDEWEKSSFNNPNDPSKHKTCIDCHMGYLKDGEFVEYGGRSTEGGELKKDIKTHFFTGSNHFLSGLKSKEHEDQTIQLLKTSAKLDLNISEDELLVGVTNVGAGHHLPTGTSDFRELWLEIDVKDADGDTILSSGKLQKDGNIEKNSRVFMKVFGDKKGDPVGLFFWRYEKLLSDTRIPAGEKRVERYAFGDKELKYPLKAVVKLNFRIYPQWVTDIVQRAYPQLPDPTVVELNKIERVFKTR